MGSSDELLLVTQQGKVRVKRAKVEDSLVVHAILDECAQWLSAQHMTHWNDVHTPESVRNLLKENTTFIASRDVIEIGTVTLSTHSPCYYHADAKLLWAAPFDLNFVYIKKLAVRPEFHRRGYASALLEFAEHCAAERNTAYVRLDFNRQFPALKRFYLERGYSFRGKSGENMLFEKTL